MRDLKIAQMNVYAKQGKTQRQTRKTDGWFPGERRGGGAGPGEGRGRPGRGGGAGPGERLRGANCCAEDKSEQGCTVEGRALEP